MKFSTYQDMLSFAECAAKAGIRATRDKKLTVEQILCIIQYGDELGIGPMASLKGITYKGTTPTVDGDLALGLVRKSGLCEYIEEWFENGTAYFKGKRKDQAKPIERQFSHEDAKKANLIGKSGPWREYETRMKRYRALGFGLRDGWPEVMQGIHITQEIEEDDMLPQPTCDTPPREERREQTAPAEQPVSEPAAPAALPSVNPVSDANLVKVSLKGLYNAFCEWMRLDPADAVSATHFKEMAALGLACNESDVDKQEKWTMPMVQKCKTYLDSLMAGGD
jgi:hypothetical protein